MIQEISEQGGVTAEGYPIVFHTGNCPHWVGQNQNGLCQIRECWYCAFADFRKNLEINLEYSPCRCPENRVAKNG
ncbi:MAG: hypothetical protein RRY64_06505 [Oscillospiraceae bacterium]